MLYESKKKLLNTQMPILRLRHYPLHLAIESDLYSWPYKIHIYIYIIHIYIYIYI